MVTFKERRGCRYVSVFGDYGKAKTYPKGTLKGAQGCCAAMSLESRTGTRYPRWRPWRSSPELWKFCYASCPMKDTIFHRPRRYPKMGKEIGHPRGATFGLLNACVRLSA